MKKRLSTSIVIPILLGSLILFAAGCSKKTVIPPGSGGSGGGSMTSGTDINYPPAGGYSEGNLSTEGNLDDTTEGRLADGSMLPENQTDEYKRIHGRSSATLYPVYFEFDQAGITADMADIMVRNAQYLNSTPGSIITIEGNCDERGTNEYNLALGERRSINARQFLIDLGIEPSRIKTLSYGEEKPLFAGLDETAYSQNRRADFVLQ